jgi:hypothetical protein
MLYTTRSVALSGRIANVSYPGLKPWAILFCHFMAMRNGAADFVALTGFD